MGGRAAVCAHSVFSAHEGRSSETAFMRLVNRMNVKPQDDR